ERADAVGEQTVGVGVAVERTAGAAVHPPALGGAGQAPVVGGGPGDQEATVAVQDEQGVTGGGGGVGAGVHRHVHRSLEVSAAVGDQILVRRGADHRGDLGAAGHEQTVHVVHAVLGPQRRHLLGAAVVDERAVGGDQALDLAL